MTREVRKWWFAKKIEDMPLDELEERIREVMALDTKSILKPIPYIGIEERVVYKTDELVALCPMTGLPDFYTLEIGMTPDKLIPELKSLKYYIIQYKEIPISHEHLASKIYTDVKETVKPKKLYVTLDVARRGGIDTSITVGDKK